MIRSKTFWIFLFFLSVFAIGFLVGRLTCPRFISQEPFVLTPQEPAAQGGSGILIPIESPELEQGPSQSHPPQGSHSESVNPLLTSRPQWFKFTDNHLSAKVRTVQADSFQYIFKKAWYPFVPKKKYISSLSVYGVAPESVKVETKIPPEETKNFFTIITLTAPNPASWNLIFGYKKVAFHIQTPISVSTKKLSYGIGYCFRF